MFRKNYIFSIVTQGWGVCVWGDDHKKNLVLIWFWEIFLVSWYMRLVCDIS